MFYCRKTSDDRSDATASYEWDVPKGTTVKDFIEYKVKLNSPEFGFICFKLELNIRDRHKYSNFKDCDYILQVYGNRIIKGPVKAEGGWSQMNYQIDIVEETPFLTHGDIYKEFLKSTKIDRDLVNDWRPCLPEYNVPHIPMAIVIWLKDKSSMIYIYKEDVE